MSTTRYLLLFAAAFVVSLLATLPAWLLGSWMSLPPGVTLAPLEGSLWRGRSPWLQFDGYRVESLQWRVSPLGLLGGNPLLVSAETPVALRGRLGPDYAGGLSLGDVEASASLAGLMDYLSLPQLGVDADISLQVEEGEFPPEGCEKLSGTLTVERWRGDMEGVDGVGPLVGRLSCDQSRVIVDVNPDNGVKLSGKLILFTDGRYAVDLRAAPPRGALYDTFRQLFGPPRNGQFVLQTRS